MSTGVKKFNAKAEAKAAEQGRAALAGMSSLQDLSGMSLDREEFLFGAGGPGSDTSFLSLKEVLRERRQDHLDSAVRQGTQMAAVSRLQTMSPGKAKYGGSALAVARSQQVASASHTRTRPRAVDPRAVGGAKGGFNPIAMRGAGSRGDADEEEPPEFFVRLQAHKYDVRERMDGMERMVDGMHSDLAAIARVRDPATGGAPRGKDYGAYLDDARLNGPRRLDGGLRARQQAEREQISQIIVLQHEMISERWRDDPLEAVLAGETAESWEAKREAAQRDARARREVLKATARMATMKLAASRSTYAGCPSARHCSHAASFCRISSAQSGGSRSPAWK